MMVTVAELEQEKELTSGTVSLADRPVRRFGLDVESGRRLPDEGVVSRAVHDTLGKDSSVFMKEQFQPYGE